MEPQEKDQENTPNRNASKERPPSNQIGSAIKKFLREIFYDNFDGLFIICVLLAIGFILYFADQKISFLNFFYIPILLAAYFKNTRIALLGALLSIGWVTLFVVLDVKSFSQNISGLGLYLHILLWASFLILTGTIVGKLHERLREKIKDGEENLTSLKNLQKKLNSARGIIIDKNKELRMQKERVESVLFDTMDPLVAKMVIDRKLVNEKRSVTILFADMLNLTSDIEEKLPDSVIHEINEIYSEMESVLTTYRGHLDKFMGDGLMAEFGTPFKTPNHSLLAVMAGIEMNKRIQDHSLPWKLRIGISTGPSLVGLIGSTHRKSYTAIGDVVNLSARLQRTCPPGSILIDEHTYKRVDRWMQCRKVRIGKNPHEPELLKEKLRQIQKIIEEKPNMDLCLKAAKLSSQLGDVEKTAHYHKIALNIAPGQRPVIEKSLASAIMVSEEIKELIKKGRSQTMTGYEVIGLKNPLFENDRLPQKALQWFDKLTRNSHFPEEELLAAEALESAIGHGRISAALAAALAETMGLNDDDIRNAFIAGYYHDIGKKSLPPALLMYEGNIENLTQKEQTLIKNHPAEAESILYDQLQIPAHPNVIEGIRQHHERFDGQGYPNGLSADEISLLARIVKVVDTYEILTSWRPFKDPLSKAEALKEIDKEMDNGSLDPKVGTMFLKLMAQP